MKSITILIPTFNRPIALATTMTSLLFQTTMEFDIIVSDQGRKFTITDIPTFQTLKRLFNEKEVVVNYHKHLPRRGIAEQRQFLLEHVTSPYALFLDDDIVLDTFVVSALRKTIEKEHCGFVGQAVIGLSFLHDVRPYQQFVEFWRGKVKPEIIRPHDRKWHRYLFHNGANIYHVQKHSKLNPNNIKKYKVAWIGGCVLYDTQKLKNVGGFHFWEKLPKRHVGEDVLAQLRVMEKYGGCGILPSGAYHQELPTTIVNRKINAPEYILTENELNL